jgi:uncharacterized repeat protein (TIGR03803 family)
MRVARVVFLILLSASTGTVLGRSEAGAKGNFRLLHSFTVGTDGSYPTGDVTAWNGALYGTTELGGKDDLGTIFEITPSGTERVLYDFKREPDGHGPTAGLVVAGDALYGSLPNGGVDCLGRFRGCGGVFGIDASGFQVMIHRFTGAPDGQEPIGDLLVANGSLFGTTALGGHDGAGTVFTIGPGGKCSIVYSFRGAPDGSFPSAGLIAVGGSLYGTTYYGGAYGGGTIFSVSASGHERVLHSFGGTASDGFSPESKLVALSGELYGTTYSGGTAGLGSVFAVRPSGAYRLVHSFEEVDGAYPRAGLVALHGKLYGTAGQGGALPAPGNGTVFELSPVGDTRVIHNFTGSDGSFPGGELAVVDEKLYGTTIGGGAQGEGTVFEVTP